MPHFNTNLPSDYGWGPADPSGGHIVPFSYGNHRFYNGVRREMAPWFTAFLDRAVPLINGGLYTAHANPSPDDGHWGFEYRKSRNSGSLSVHSWGCCIDINAVQNPNGRRVPNGGRFVLGSDISELARSMGGLHGREFPTPDQMHIECKLDPGELQAWLAAHHGGGHPAPLPAPAHATSGAGVKAFPLPAGYYYGPFSGPAESISGAGKNDAPYRAGLALIQTKLHVPADGAYGPVTASAIKAFQTAHHLTADGLVGPATWKALTA